MNDILKEAEADLAQEKLRVFFQKHTGKLVGSVVVLLLAAAGGSWIQNQKQEKLEALNVQYHAAEKFIADNAFAEASNTLDALGDQEGEHGFGTLARFRKGSLLVMQNRDEEAQKLYIKLSNDSAISPLLRDYATILYAYSALNAPTGLDAPLTSALTKIIAAKGAWQFAAQEILALQSLQELQKISNPDKKRVQETAEKFQALSEEAEAPRAMQQRVEAILTVLPQLLKTQQ
jgi:hypothetical protein